jgi:hypothetical protein
MLGLLGVDGFAVPTLEVRQVRLLIERGALEPERVDNIVDLDRCVLNALLSLLGGRVGANVCMVG